MTAEIANNVILGSIFLIVSATLNIISVILLIYAARTNTKTARMLKDVAEFQAKARHPSTG